MIHASIAYVDDKSGRKVTCIAKAISAFRNLSSSDHIVTTKLDMSLPIDMRVVNEPIFAMYDKIVLAEHVTSCGLVIAGPMFSHLDKLKFFLHTFDHNLSFIFQDNL